MNSGDIYIKTPLGEEAMTQRTRVVQRSQRMILVLVDGKTTVAELGQKVSDPRLAEAALKELELGGFIVSVQAASAAKAAPAAVPAVPARTSPTASQLSQFSTFGPRPGRSGAGPGVSAASAETVMPSSFSTFGRPQPEKPRPAPKVPAAVAPDDAVADDTPWTPPPRSRPWGRWLAGGVSLFLLALAGTVFLYPYEQFKPELEASLSQQLGTPVRIASLGPQLMPTPMLELRQVSLGERGEGRIERLSLPHLHEYLIGGSREARAPVQLQGGHLSLAQLANWLGRAGAGAPRELVWQNLRLTLGDYSLAEVEGRIQRGPDGRLQHASLMSADRSFRVELQPQGRELALSWDASGWKLANTALQFDFVSGKGLLRPDKLAFSAIDMRLLGGRYEGELLLDWGLQPGLVGTGYLHRLNLGQVAEALGSAARVSGDLSGNLRFRSQGLAQNALLDSLQADGDWQVERGELRGLDLAEAVRRGRGQMVKGGATRFERMSAQMHLDAQGLQLTGMQLEAGLLQAEGQLRLAPGGQVSGALGVSLARGPQLSQASIGIAGQFPNLEATAQ